MKLNLKEDWKLLSKRAAIFYIVFSIINLLTFILLVVHTDAGIISPLIYFVFWQVAIWVYYMFRYKFRNKVSGGEWIDAAMFAIIAATLIRTFFIETYLFSFCTSRATRSRWQVILRSIKTSVLQTTRCRGHREQRYCGFQLPRRRR